MKPTVFISPEAEKVINDILSRENDVLIKYKKTKARLKF